MNKRVLTGILAIILLFSGAIRAKAVSYHEGSAEKYIINQLGAVNIPGMSVSIVTSQKEIYSAAFGDVEETSSSLQIGALTRTFTSLAIMQLVEDGVIKLEDKVSGYIDNTEAGLSSSVTIQELLSYTDINAMPQNVKLINGLEIYDTSTDGEILQINAKFNLLGEIVEKVSGKSYASYIRENITGPLEMQSTYVLGETGANTNIIPGNRNYFGLPLKDSVPDNGEYWLGLPSSGLVSDVKDLGKYMQMYLSAGGKTISYNTIESIMDKGRYAGKSIFGTDAYYSMGWISTEANGEKMYYCSGSIDNYTSAMFIIPSLDVGVAMLFNSSDVITGQKFTDKIEAGVVSLVMGNTAESVSSNAYLMEHGIAGIICFLALVCGLLPLLMMEVWVRWTKERFSIIRISIDVILHIILPTSLIFLTGYYIGQWNIIMKVVPDLAYVAMGVIGLFYFGGIIKIISYFVIAMRRNKKEEDASEEITREENAVKEDINNNGILQDSQDIGINIPEYKARDSKEDKKDRRGKKDNKDKKEKKTGHIKKTSGDKLWKSSKEEQDVNAQEKEDNNLQDIPDVNTEAPIITEDAAIITEEVMAEEPVKEEVVKEEPVKEEITSGSPEEKPVDNVIENKPEETEYKKYKAGNTENDIEKKEDKSNAGIVNRQDKRPARETGKPGIKNIVKARPDQAKKDNRPRRFIVVNDNALPDKEKNRQENGNKYNKKGNSYKKAGMNAKNAGNRNINNKNAFNKGNTKNNFNKKH